jgi:ribosome-binding protein aMBF1 (putative translation factor)
MSAGDVASGAADEAAGVCEICDRESKHLSRWLDPDGSVHYVCWSCLQRREKRVNVNQRWRRGRRGDAAAK